MIMGHGKREREYDTSGRRYRQYFYTMYRRWRTCTTPGKLMGVYDYLPSNCTYYAKIRANALMALFNRETN